jgi:hypothetical protein
MHVSGEGGESPAVPWGALAAAAAVLAGLQFVTRNLIGIDAGFHIRYAQVIREAGPGGFPPAFPWLPLTILAPDRYADHHLLYHLLLVPFTWGDLRLGGKLAALAGAVGFAGAFTWFLRRERVPLPALALLALGASSADFLFRLSMARVQALSLVCLLVGLQLALARRHRALAVLACVYTWLYDGFPLLGVAVGAVVVADLVAARRVRPGIVVATVGGVAAGLVLNPYFPGYLQFMVHHFGDKLLPAETLRVGREWMPYDPVSLLGNALPSMLYVAFGVAVRGGRGLARDGRALAALLLALTFLALTLRSQRFIEYFAPCATVFVALAAAPAVAALAPRRRRRLAVLLAVLAAANVGGVAWAIATKTRDVERWAAPARYVADAAPAGAMLCTTDWDDFPSLYFYNVASTYLIGLDPTYLHDRFRDAYWHWVDVTQGRSSTPSRILGGQLPCAYMLSDRAHGAFLAQAAEDPGLEEILADEHWVLYRVRRDGPPPLYPTTVD